MIKAIAIAVWAAVAIVYAGRFLSRQRRRATIDASVLVRCMSSQAALERRLTEQTDQLAELARKRYELLREACLALGLTLPERSRDTELLQALRAAGIMHERALKRLQHELSVRDDALAAVASVVLEQAVTPGEYSPAQVVRLATARARRARA